MYSAAIHRARYFYKLTRWPFEQKICGDHATRLAVSSFHVLSYLLIASQLVYDFFAAHNILEQLL